MGGDYRLQSGRTPLPGGVRAGGCAKGNGRGGRARIRLRRARCRTKGGGEAAGCTRAQEDCAARQPHPARVRRTHGGREAAREPSARRVPVLSPHARRAGVSRAYRQAHCRHPAEVHAERRRAALRSRGAHRWLRRNGREAQPPRLYQTEPSGAFSEWKAQATGRNAKTIREFLEKNYEELPRDGCVKLAARALLEVVEASSRTIEIAVATPEGLTLLSQEELQSVVDTVEAEKEAGGGGQAAQS